MRDGSRCRTYDFSGKSGQSISLSVNSNDFEPYIIVQGSQGAIWQGKIQKGGEVDIKLPADDTYRLIVSPVKPQDMGSFTISIETKRSTTAQISQR